ncbi:MAG: pseudouridine synthase [Bacteroidetes bacterium]|nr:pseudouridine synthase [Bacteroidota bacterium]
MERNSNRKTPQQNSRNKHTDSASHHGKPDFKKKAEPGARRSSSFNPRHDKADNTYVKSSYKDREDKPKFTDNRDKPAFRDNDKKSFDRPSRFTKSDNSGERGESRFKPRLADKDSKPAYRDKSENRYGDNKERSFKPKFADKDSKPAYRDKGGKSEFKVRKAGDAGEGKTQTREYKKGYQKDDRPFSEKKRAYDDDKTNDRYLHKNKPRRRTSEIDLPIRERPKRADVLELKNFKSTNRPAVADTIRLNKYISNAGICSRREADDLIQSGAVAINGVIVTELGTKVLPTDTVQYGGETLVSEKKKYLLLNKPKGYITTVEDPMERRTVMALVKDACKERLYPVGRLDRNTTGLLIFTNDGEMAKKLTHPRYGIKKVYHVELDRALSRADMDKILDGIELEDGIVKVDEIAYIDEHKNKKEIGIEIHTGKNRVIRRIFETLGYDVVKLDRTMFAGLTKKDISRGMWRFLTEKEVSFLKMLQ